jgi:hypothetical protein
VLVSMRMPLAGEVSSAESNEAAWSSTRHTACGAEESLKPLARTIVPSGSICRAISAHRAARAVCSGGSSEPDHVMS